MIVVAALGNCVFHPADFTILNANVHQHHLGRAFSIHTLGGNLGWAAAPIFMLLLANAFGWRWALVGAAVAGATLWLLLWVNGDRLREESGQSVSGRSTRISASISLLLSAPMLLCFGYFVLLAAALIAVQNFLPPSWGDCMASRSF